MARSLVTTKETVGDIRDTVFYLQNALTASSQALLLRRILLLSKTVVMKMLLVVARRMARRVLPQQEETTQAMKITQGGLSSIFTIKLPRVANKTKK